MERKNTCVEVFGKRLKELRKTNGYMIEQFADMVGMLNRVTETVRSSLEAYREYYYE